MVLITIEAAKKKVPRAPELPYSISFPDAGKVTIEDVKSCCVKFPKVRPYAPIPILFLQYIHVVLFVFTSNGKGANFIITMSS
jgi:hypothetical protein